MRSVVARFNIGRSIKSASVAFGNKFIMHSCIPQMNERVLTQRIKVGDYGLTSTSVLHRGLQIRWTDTKNDLKSLFVRGAIRVNAFS